MTVALLSRCTSPAGQAICRPRASTALPHTHVWGSHALHPSLCATAILISSSDTRSPTDVIGGAASQSPECGDDAANSLALSMSVEACDQTTPSCRSTTNLSHALWMCADSAPGFWLLHKEVHLVSAAGRDSSSNDPTDSGRMDCWRSCIDAAEARKVEGASICALLIPSPPCLTGRLAWSHWVSLRSTFRILDRPDLRMSKVARSGLSEQSAFRRRYSNFGMLRLFFSKTRAF